MNILVVEDEIDTLNEIVDYIMEYDETFNCIAYQDPTLVLEKVTLNEIDIAFLDIEMPMMNGLELANKIANIHPEIKIAFITAYNNHAAEAFEVNAIDYLLKPLRKERLHKTLKKLAVVNNNRMIMQPITIQTFRKLVISNGDRKIKWKRKKSLEIFAFLLSNKERPIHKNSICDTMWPAHDPSRALVNLQTVMYQLRKSLAEVCKDEIHIEYTNNSYQLILGKCHWDVDEFEKNYQKAFYRKKVDELALLDAYRAYGGAYLEEDGWLWALPMQQSLEIKYRKVLEELIYISKKQKMHDKVVEYIEEIGLILYDNDEKTKKYFLTMLKILGKERALSWRKRISE